MDLFFEDLHEGFSLEVGPFALSSSEIAAFARQWDPQPYHLQEGNDGEILDGQIASGLHTLAATFRQFVLADLFSGNIVLGLGYERVRFIEPVRPGEKLHARATLKAARRSQSKPYLGVLTWNIIATRAAVSVLEAVVINFIKASTSPCDQSKAKFLQRL